MHRVTPKPWTGPVAKKNSNPAASSVVTFESITALHAFAKPVFTGFAKSLERTPRYSSLARSKTRTFASTAMPIARTNPASPGSVSVAPSATRAAYEMRPYSARAKAASAPRSR